MSSSSMRNTSLSCVISALDLDLTSKLRLTGKTYSYHLKTIFIAQNAVKSSCQIQSFSGFQKYKNFKNGSLLREEHAPCVCSILETYPLPPDYPLLLCCMLCKCFPVLIFQVASQSRVDIPLSVFSFFTITLFYTNNRLLCFCPLNLEKKNPTPQMSGERRGEGYFFHKLTRKSNNSTLSHCSSLKGAELEFSSYPYDGSQSVIYQSLLECKTNLTNSKLVCKFSCTVFMNSAVIIFQICPEEWRIT